jgi:hypothetical protein
MHVDTHTASMHLFSVTNKLAHVLALAISGSGKTNGMHHRKSKKKRKRKNFLPII